jgi:hypothetical integral membrane protein (TIGR02206 family)
LQTGFQLFGPKHLAVIGLVPITAGLLAVTRRRFPRTAKPFRYGLALLLVACTVSYYGSWIVPGERIFPGHMPLELCDFALWLVIATLMTLKPVIYDVVYYWALIGTAMAVVTPNLTHPSLFMEIQFFADHGFIVVAVLYLAWSGQLRPRPGSSGKSLLTLNAVAVIVGAFDLVFKTNYMFLRDTPPGKTLMNAFGLWPWYIAVCEGLGMVLFPLLYLPFWRRHPDALAIEKDTEDQEAGIPAPQ